MNIPIVKIVANLLRDLANKLDTGNSELSETEAMDIMSILSHRVMSKETACRYLNYSKSQFDNYVRSKQLPLGRKRVGFKEKVWYQDELDTCIEKIKKHK